MFSACRCDALGAALPVTKGRIVQVEDDPRRPIAFPGGGRRIMVIVVDLLQIPAPIERGWQRR